MSFKVRSVLVLVVGTVLGLTVSLAGNVLVERGPRSAAYGGEAMPAEYLVRLGEVMERIRSEYVDDVDDQQLLEGAIRGMFEELDTHSRYLDSRQYEDIRISTTGIYSGVGLDISLENGLVTVVSPMQDAPAARAGILPGDVVISVDNVPVNEDNVEDTVNRMRGDPGTSVMLGVLRDGDSDAMRFALTRAAIQVKTVRSEYLGDGYAYIRLSGFSDNTAGDLDDAARSLYGAADDQLKGLVLDLRNNPGGVLDAAIRVADLFLDEGLIVRGKGRIRQARFEQFAHAGDELEQVPLVVLVNAGSASASEIVAGAIKDHDRGQLVGERTYGKGSVQTVVPLSAGSALKLTTSRYLTPLGKSINGKGIDPDVIVRNADPNKQYRGQGGSTSMQDDEQLQQALRLIGYEPIALSKAP